MAWLALANVSLEVLVILKYAGGQFDHVTVHPTVIVYSWAAVGVGLALFTIFYFYIFKIHERKPKKSKTE
jgi:hypothetical protein